MTPEAIHILVVEDDKAEREALKRMLKHVNYHVSSACNPTQALEYIDDNIDLVLSDLRMGETSGVDLLRMWKERQPRTPFILVTAFGKVESAVDAMKLGADDYLTKPVNPDEMLIVIERCVENSRKDETIRKLAQRLDKRFGFEKIIGESKPMQNLFMRIRRAAEADSTVLITGESGTGKELAAEAIHQNSPRKDGPFVAVNMAAVPENLVESELFGHVKGAFTGATASRIGRFEAANGGTIFIDEIGDFALESQAKLLRVLENRTITPVGGNDEKHVDVRVVAATSRNLEELVKEQRFREDLYYRLGVIVINQPPLRDRKSDIALLARHFLDQLCAENNRPEMTCDPELMRFLESFDWPGNVRQLKNCIESMIVMSSTNVLTKQDLPANILSLRPEDEHELDIPPDTSLHEIERHAIEQALEQHHGNRTQAAESLGISTRTLQRRLREWNNAEKSAEPAD